MAVVLPAPAGPTSTSRIRPDTAMRVKASAWSSPSITFPLARVRALCVGGRNGALREQATTGREAGFRVESRIRRRGRACQRAQRPTDRGCGKAKDTRSNTADRRGSGHYANSSRAGRERERAGAPVRSPPRHRVGKDSVMLVQPSGGAKFDQASLARRAVNLRSHPCLRASRLVSALTNVSRCTSSRGR